MVTGVVPFTCADAMSEAENVAMSVKSCCCTDGMSAVFNTSRMLSDVFQSTHPVRGGTCYPSRDRRNRWISIHPPREGWDGNGHRLPDVGVISIHPPREGWDEKILHPVDAHEISIHPPREGWDTGALAPRGSADISIHPPREGWDLDGTPLAEFQAVISIHPPREGWDCVRSGARVQREYFNPPTP